MLQPTAARFGEAEAVPCALRCPGGTGGPRPSVPAGSAGLCSPGTAQVRRAAAAPARDLHALGLQLQSAAAMQLQPVPSTGCPPVGLISGGRRRDGEWSL